MVRIQHVHDCEFCDELSAGSRNSFSRVYGELISDRVLFRSKDVVVVPSLGQLAEGHMLVLPVRHLTAAADLPSALLKEFAKLLLTVERILIEQSGPVVLFEHGIRTPGQGGCGISHAHVHVVPFHSLKDPGTVLRQQFRCTNLSSFEEITNASTGMASYLFFQDRNAGKFLFDTGPLPSQYMRKLVSDAIGASNWDWRTAGREERLLATIHRLSGKFGTLESVSFPNG